MKQISELSIVIPAYNEAESLKQLLPKLIKEAHCLAATVELLVVDAMTATDNTEDVCKAMAVRHLNRIGGNSYGDAVRTGIRESSGRYVLLMDADGSHNPSDISKLWNNRRSCDVVIGSRYVTGGNTENPAILIWMSKIVNLIYRFSFGLKVKDVSNSFRLYRGDQLRSLVLESNNFDIVEEILIRLVCGPTRASIMEEPVTFERRKAGESKRKLTEFALSYLDSIKKMRRFRAAEIKKIKIQEGA